MPLDGLIKLVFACSMNMLYFGMIMSFLNSAIYSDMIKNLGSLDYVLDFTRILYIFFLD